MSLENILNLKHGKVLAQAIQASQMGDPFRFSALHRARAIAQYLIEHQGNLVTLTMQIKKLHHLFLGIDRLYLEHQIHILEVLEKDPELWKKITSAYLPKSMSATEGIIRYSLQLKGQKLEDRHVQQALLSAALTPLRQNVGSCFATAPAITTQQYHLDLFIDDCLQLMTMGVIKRIQNGVELIVPMSPSWGQAESNRPLSINWDQSPAILLALHGETPSNAKTLNDVLKTDEARYTYQSFFDHALLKTWEYSLASFCDYKVELYRWNLLSALGMNPEGEGIGKLLYQLIEERLNEENQKVAEFQLDVNTAHAQIKHAQNAFEQATSSAQAHRRKAELTTGAYQFEQSKAQRDQALHSAKNFAELFNFLVRKIQDYFDEYFQEIFDPQMTDVQDGIFDDSPAGFRLVYKHGIAVTNQWTLIRTEDEYTGALIDFFRMVENRLLADCEWEEGKRFIPHLITAVIQELNSKGFIQQAQKRVRAMHRKAHTGAKHLTPWSYLSGGSMEHLIKSYFSIEAPLVKEERIIKSPTELLIFFIETLKNAPAPITNEGRPLFAYSPTHAFRLLPSLPAFKQAWQNNVFTYTWLRDEYTNPSETYYANASLSMKEMNMIQKQLQLPIIDFTQPLSPQDFRQKVSVQSDPSFLSELDGLIMQALCKASKNNPNPLFVGDTNWPGMLFAFAFNPATLELDLWRSDPDFLNPRPMHEWREHLNGLSQNPWGIFLHTF